LAGEAHVAGVDYNDERHDVYIGSDRDLSDGARGIHGSEVEDVAFMREVRALRRKTPRATKVRRIRHASRFQPLAEYVPDIRCSMIEQIAWCLAIRADLRAYSPAVHGLILLSDEMSVQAVLQQKKMMQAPACTVGLGSSPTNNFAYAVWIHAKLTHVSRCCAPGLNTPRRTGA
jgi:hypothetical protein